MPKPSLAVALTFAFLLGGCAWFQQASRPDDDSYRVPRTPERVARGDYLANHLLGCADCHAGISPATKALDTNEPWVGGGVYGHAAGLPGEIYAPNITQAPRTGLGAWSDRAIMRAIREGRDNEGKALFPIMPYKEYHDLSDEDTEAVVAYLRTLAPIEHEVPERKLDFPLNLLVNVMPEAEHGPVKPPSDDRLARGKYLVTLAGCAGCHTPMDHGQAIEARRMAGGHTMHFLDQPPDEPGLRLPNITPDKETGIGGWTDEQLRVALTQGRRPDGRYLKPSMPWVSYARLTPEDVDAIVAYMHTVKPVKSR